MTAFSAWLRAQLETRSLSISEFARRMGKSPTSVMLWLRGSTIPSATSIAALSEELGVPEAEIREALRG
jgi:transcriptional regulator with XRE-family HTH domain